jgi:arsenical pump membrane protein
MGALLGANGLTWAIAALATGGVILRPWRLPEAIWATLGALALIVLGLMPLSDALRAVARGADVYLFLIGMMLLSEVARREGLFDHVAAVAARHARGSARRLFVLIYAVGTVVTVFLSNDATAVVLTPAVYAAARAAKAEPLPYLLVCAFIANAASFVLPISNPANLVVFASRMPPLLEWLERFALPSVLSIAATFVVLRLTQRAALRQALATDIEAPGLSRAGRLAACGIGVTAVALLATSAADLSLGAPTFAAGAATAALVLLLKREAPWETLRGVSWAVLPLVAGLFVLVESLDRTGVIRELSRLLRDAADASVSGAAWASGVIVALACNVMNNLPAGLIAGSTATAAQLPPDVRAALMIGVDLGPNLSVTGSLATILWLVALRREGEDVSAWQFLKLGALVMPPALLLALAGLLVRFG